MKGPVIILGSVRTGSSLLVRSLRNLGYEGHSEGHLFYLFKLLDDTIDHYYRDNRHFRFDDSLFKEISAESIKKISHESIRGLISTVYQSDFWIEKTVNRRSLFALPTIFEIWPTALGIFTSRRPLEAIRSRLVKFPKESLTAHICEIRNIHRHWLEIRASYPNITEIEHFDLVHNRDEVARKLAQHLDLDPFQQQQLRTSFEDSSEERTSSSYTPISIKDLGMNKRERDLLISELDFIFEAFGYSYDENYFKVDKLASDLTNSVRSNRSL